jgi:hypothetical protein
MSEDNYDFISKYGSPKHKDKLADSKDYKARRSLVRNNPEYHGELKHDSDPSVRNQVAVHTNDKEHLDHLVNDPSSDVRASVARRGHKDHLDKLVHDSDWYVRNNVAQHGHEDHMDKLVNDPSSDVRVSVAMRGQERHHDKLVNDSDRDVRANVAERGNEKHRERLMNDPDVNVRLSVAHNATSHKVIGHLTHDSNSSVVRSAMERPARVKKFSDFLSQHGDDPLLK